MALSPTSSRGGGSSFPDEWTVYSDGSLDINVATVSNAHPIFQVSKTQTGIPSFTVEYEGTPTITLGDQTFTVYVPDVDFGFRPLSVDSDGVTVSLSAHYSTIFDVRAEGSVSKPLLRAGYNDTKEIVVGYAAAKVGFYGTDGIVKQTGVPVTDAGIHAALVALGLFAA
jgi:hypothetical protein